MARRMVRGGRDASQAPSAASQKLPRSPQRRAGRTWASSCWERASSTARCASASSSRSSRAGRNRKVRDQARAAARGGWGVGVGVGWGGPGAPGSVSQRSYAIGRTEKPKMSHAKVVWVWPARRAGRGVPGASQLLAGAGCWRSSFRGITLTHLGWPTPRPANHRSQPPPPSPHQSQAMHAAWDSQVSPRLLSRGACASATDVSSCMSARRCGEPRMCRWISSRSTKRFSAGQAGGAEGRAAGCTTKLRGLRRQQRPEPSQLDELAA